MNIETLIEKTTEAVAAIPYLAGRPVITDERGDTSNELDKNIAKTNFAAIVGWNGYDADANSSKTVYGKVNVVVSLYERPVVNRKITGAPTLLNAAQEIAKAVNLFTAGGMNSPLVFTRITPVQELGDGKTIACDVHFETKATL